MDDLVDALGRLLLVQRDVISNRWVSKRLCVCLQQHERGQFVNLSVFLLPSFNSTEKYGNHDRLINTIILYLGGDMVFAIAKKIYLMICYWEEILYICILKSARFHALIVIILNKYMNILHKQLNSSGFIALLNACVIFYLWVWISLCTNTWTL